MPKQLALTCLGIFITYPALGAGLDPIRVARYSAIAPGPSAEQVDLFTLPVHTEFPFSIQTVGGALEHVLTPSGYRLASIPASCPSLPALLAWPLPAVHRRLGPMRLDEALKTLAGPAHYLVVDPVHRLVSFELREEYQALVGAGIPGRPGSSSTADLIESNSAERTVLEPPPAPAPELSALAGGFGAISTSDGTHGTERIGPIEEGTKLWTIAVDLRESFNASAEQVMVALFEANSGSFCYRNLNCLKAGAYLDLPTANGVATTTPSDARRVLQSHFRAWRQRGRSDAVADATRKEVMAP
ncbi:MAG: FimV/HubP family polar landmark protein [Gammaproteobacteria bacterium]